jgi:tight adherence protein B
VSFAVATFAISLVIIFGAYWALVLRPEQAGKTATMGRIERARERAAPRVVMAQDRLSHIPFLDAVLRHRQDVAGPIDRLITESGLKMTVGTFVLMVIVAGLAGAVLSWTVTHLLFVSVIAGVAAASLPYLYVNRKRTVRLRTFEEQFPEAIDLVSRALRAGHALTTGLGMVPDEIPPPVGEEFRRLYDEQNFGMSLPEAMRAMARRVPVLDARFFVTAVLTQRETGGNLSEVLDRLAGVIRERFKVKRQVRAVSAHGRITGVVLGFLPPVVASLIFIVSPEHIRLLVDDPLGLYMLAGGAVLQVVGVLIIRKIVDVEY